MGQAPRRCIITLFLIRVYPSASFLPTFLCACLYTGAACKIHIPRQLSSACREFISFVGRLCARADL